MNGESKNNNGIKWFAWAKFAAFIITILICVALILINVYNMKMVYDLSDDIDSLDTYERGYAAASSTYNTFLNTGLTVLGVAISVWVGVNVYNVVEREQVKKLEEKYKELESFYQLSIAQQNNLINSLKTGNANQRILSLATSLQYKEYPNRAIKDKILGLKATDFNSDESYATYFLKIENAYVLLRESFSRGYRREMGEKGLKYCKELLEKEADLHEEEKRYLFFRMGELNYYLAQEYYTHNINKGIEYYTNARNYYENKLVRESFLNDFGYIDQSIGSAYLLQSLNSAAPERRNNLKKAYDLICEAIEKDDSQGTWYKNRGVANYHLKKLGENISNDAIKADYHKAIELCENAEQYNHRNYLALAGILLEELQVKIFGRGRLTLSMIQSPKVNCEYADITQTIDEIKDLYKSASKYSYEDIEPLYKSLQLNLCLLLFYRAIGNEEKENEYMDEASRLAKKVEELDVKGKPTPAKFQLRNYYAAMGDTKNALGINEVLKKDSGSDANTWYDTIEAESTKNE